MSSAAEPIHHVPKPAIPDRRNARVLDPVEAASLIHVESRTLIRWARLGYVPAHPLGEGKRKFWRFFEDEILAWLEARSNPARRPAASSMEKAIGARARKSA
jgi:hypothetical protein